MSLKVRYPGCLATKWEQMRTRLQPLLTLTRCSAGNLHFPFNKSHLTQRCFNSRRLSAIMELQIEKKIVTSSCSPSARIFPQHSYVWSMDLSIRSSIRPCLPASIYPSFPICLSVHAPAAPESYQKCDFMGGECSSVHPLLDTLSQT